MDDWHRDPCRWRYDRLVTRTVRSFCRFCEAACGILVEVSTDEAGIERVERVRGDLADPLSRGYTCGKGRSLPVWHHHPLRLNEPEVSDGAGGFKRIGWSETLDDIAARIRSTRADHGPDSVGVLLATGSAFDALGRRMAERLWQQLGSRSKYTSGSVDTPCKPLVSRLLTGFPGLVPTLDLDASELTILIGVNPVVSHGHLNGMPDPVSLLRRLASGGRELWVVDPRRSESSALATGHLAPRPGTDHLLLAHIIRELLLDGADAAYLRRHCRPEDVKKIEELVEPWDLETCVEVTGVDEAELSRLVNSVRRFGRLSCQTGTGTTMSREANLIEWMVWVLQIVTGSLDVRGGAWFNPGFLRQLDARTITRAGSEPSPGPRSRPELRDWTNEFPCSALVDEIEAGNLHGLVILGGNPLRALPEPERLTRALKALEFLVVVDVVETDTTRIATHKLPVAGQLERGDVSLSIDQFVVTLSTRFTEAVVKVGANRRPAWWVMTQLAERLDLDISGSDADRSCAPTEEAMLDAILARSKGDPTTIRRDGYAIREPTYGWVLERVLDGGRFELAPDLLVDQWKALAHTRRDDLVLIPRRQPRHLNSQLAEDCGQARVDVASLLIHPTDAGTRGLSDGQEVIVKSRHGSVRAIAEVTPDIRLGAVSLPHGFGSPNICELTSSREDVDELSGMVWQGGFPVSVDSVT